MSKYYFITFITRRLGRQYLDSDVISEHPFEWFKKAQSESNNKIVLVGWQEISKEEYDMYDKDGIGEDLNQPGVPRAYPYRSKDLDPSDLGGLES
jgi:hypothetical protein